MNGSGMIMFRTSRKGYDKGDVHRYIEEMNIRFASAEEKAKQQIRRLEAELEKASLGETPVDETALQALSQENEALKAELEALRAALADAKRNGLRLTQRELADQLRRSPSTITVSMKFPLRQDSYLETQKLMSVSKAGA